MSFNGILALHSVNDPVRSLEPIVSMARATDAHLHIQLLNLAPPIPTMAFNQNPEFDWNTGFQDVLGKSSHCLIELQNWLRDIQFDASVSSSCQQLGLIDDEVATTALYADLIITRRGSESMVTGMIAKALEGAMFNAGKPALVLGKKMPSQGMVFQRITIAWDPTPPTMKALTAALPLLRSADNVELLIVTSDRQHESVDVEAAPVLQWLSRQGIKAQLKAHRDTDHSVSGSLLTYINQSSSDLLVMGAYGHRKLTQRLFGGVSNTLIDLSEKNLFIAH
jgi:nucleotide-binding universal stress UspA family protein